MAAREYKLILVGEGGVGKTTWLQSVRRDVFGKSYFATLGVEIHTLSMDTATGPVEFTVWDTAGQDKFGGDRPSYYKDAHAALIFHDLSSAPTFRAIPKWISTIRRICPNIPIFIVGSKMDAHGAERRVMLEHVNFTLSAKGDSHEKRMEPLVAVMNALV